MSSLITKIKSKIHAILFWQSSFGEILNKIYDLKLFYKYSFKKETFKSKDSIRAYLIKQYHIVEKGLALPNPRKGFGVEKIKHLIKITTRYIDQYGNDELTSTIKSCLQEYLVFNSNNNVDMETAYFNNVKDFIGTIDSNNKGGIYSISKEELNLKTNIGFESFVKSRFSVRDFDEQDLDIEKVNLAVNIAKHAPSVCNRQSWKAHLYTDKDQILKLLKLQGGNNGFTESINKLVVVTTNIKSFTIMESNQAFIDGGIFSMNLILAFHSLSIGACCLNTCFPYTKSKTVKKAGGIPENERLIMMIGIGNLKNEYKVAMSNKKDLEEVINIH